MLEVQENLKTSDSHVEWVRSFGNEVHLLKAPLILLFIHNNILTLFAQTRINLIVKQLQIKTPDDFRPIMNGVEMLAHWQEFLDQNSTKETEAIRNLGCDYISRMDDERLTL